MGKCSPRCIYVSFSLLIFFGCVIIAAGFVFPWFVNTQLQNGLKSMLVVDSFDASNFETWSNSTTSNTPPYYERFYLYNVTNHEAVERGEEKPNLVQVGPYSWLKKQIKFNISFPDNGNQAKYKTWTYYTFDPTTSAGDPYTDRITTLNIPFQAVRANLGKNWWQSLAFDAIASATNSSMFVTLAPNDLCWGGYQYPILEFLSKLQPGTPTTFALLPNYTSIENADNLTSFDTFLTGKSSLNDIQNYVEWQQNTSLAVWGSEQCNQIKGTDGTQFHPGVDPSETLTLFIDTVFRTGYLVGNGTTTIEGIDMIKFDIVATQLMNATLYPPNAGFYMWLPTGLANLTVVSNGAPVFLSKPHFLDADPSYLEAVDGLSPNRSIHDTSLYVEPISGLTMSAHKRLQINVYVDSLLMLYENVSSIYFPIGWIEESSTITPELAGKFKSSVYGALNMARISKYVGWIAGPVFVVVGIVAIVSYRFKQKKSYVDYYKINQDDD